MVKGKLLGIIGTGGAVFAALCCIGTPAALGLLTAVGFGFLINDFILIPLLLFFVALAVYGFSASRKRASANG
jgi:mercuric ion transport protein